MASLRVLWLEDSDDDAAFFNRALRHFPQLSVFRVEDGRLGVDYLRGAPPYADRSKFPLPDIILCDLRMPVMNGLEFIQWLRDDPRFKALPLIIFSGSGLRQEADQAVGRGANHYLSKPLELSGWNSTTQSILDISSKLVASSPET